MPETISKIKFIIVYALVMAVASAIVKHLFEHLNVESMYSGHDAAVRAMIVHPDPKGTKLCDIGGLQQAKEELIRSVMLPLKHPRVFFGGPNALRPPMGVLLHGPPGTGKTSLVRALASESNVTMLALTSAALESKWWGESPKILQAVFDLARTDLQPCIVFFDEIDGFGRTRSEQDQSCVYTFKCELLRNIDSVKDAPVVVIACTNCPHALDPALRRRFTRVVNVGVPTNEERLDILRVLTRDEHSIDDALLKRVADVCESLTGADLAALFNDASAARMDTTSLETALESITDGHDLFAKLGPLTWEHWSEAAQRRGISVKP